MISALGFLATGNEQLADALERTLVALANNQTQHGHISSLAHDPANRGSSDSTPLFPLRAGSLQNIEEPAGVPP